MKLKRTLIITVTLSLMVLIFTISSCNMPTLNRAIDDGMGMNDNRAVVYSEPSLTLEWDYDTSTPVDYFNLYYKSHSSPNWTLFVSTESSLAELTIDHSSLGNGDWDFGVTSVAFDGAESEIHSSLDRTALPETGWYVAWSLN